MASCTSASLIFFRCRERRPFEEGTPLCSLAPPFLHFHSLTHIHTSHACLSRTLAFQAGRARRGYGSARCCRLRGAGATRLGRSASHEPRPSQLNGGSLAHLFKAHWRSVCYHYALQRSSLGFQAVRRRQLPGRRRDGLAPTATRHALAQHGPFLAAQSLYGGRLARCTASAAAPSSHCSRGSGSALLPSPSACRLKRKRRQRQSLHRPSQQPVWHGCLHAKPGCRSYDVRRRQHAAQRG